MAARMRTDGCRWLVRLSLSYLCLVIPGSVWAQCPATLHTSCATICDSGSTSTHCQITSCKKISPGATLDCGTKDVSIQGSLGRLRVEDGVVTLKAHNLSVGVPDYTTNPTTNRVEAIRTSGSTDGYGIAIELSGNYFSRGYLKAQGKGGGSVHLLVEGDVDVHAAGDGILADGTGTDSPGGEIVIRSGGSILLNSSLLANSGGSGSALGGRIEVHAAGSVSGGTSGSRISANGRAEEGEVGGGGTILLSAGTDLTLVRVIEAEGGLPYGDGGEVHLEGDSIVINDDAYLTTPATISARGGVGASGGKAAGGLVTMTAGPGGISIGENSAVILNMTGGASGAGQDAGALIATSDGPIVLDEVLVDAKSNHAGGDGGSISLTAAGSLTIGAATTLDARGRTVNSAEGVGDEIRLAGCTVTITPGATLRTNGYEGGPISIVAREALYAGGTYNSSGTGPDGDVPIRLVVRWRGVCSTNWSKKCADSLDCPGAYCVFGNPSVHSGASFTPSPPEILAERSLPSCN